nr:MAG TPA: hypothetical protein [Ackermannviridae sp.]
MTLHSIFDNILLNQKHTIGDIDYDSFNARY